MSSGDEGRTRREDLLRPTVSDGDLPGLSGTAPWNLGSQLYVAFFGGPIAITIIAALNARRLRLDRRAQTIIVALGVAALIAAVVFAVVLTKGDPDVFEGRNARFAGRIAAIVAYFGMARVQSAADRAYQMRTGGAYESLWGPGFAAVIVGALLQLGIVAAAFNLA